MDEELSIEPDPSPAERRAIERGLSRAAADEGAGARGAWWALGVRENVADPALSAPGESG